MHHSDSPPRSFSLDSLPIRLDRDTQLCASLSARPGHFGTRFHNFLFQALGINCAYKGFPISDIAGALQGLRALGFRGAGVSMPFKESCLPFLDELDPEALAIGAVNTIVQSEGRLKGFNTDYLAMVEILKNRVPGPRPHFVLRGSGGMAKAIAHALHACDYREGTILARNESTGRALAERYGWQWKANPAELLDYETAGLLIQATPLGMAGGRPEETQGLAFSTKLIEQSTVIIESVAIPTETPLVNEARRLRRSVITGDEILLLQGIEQFVLYTGIRPEAALVAKAFEYAMRPGG